jgi:hypothetical protein
MTGVGCVGQFSVGGEQRSEVPRLSHDEFPRCPGLAAAKGLFYVDSDVVGENCPEASSVTRSGSLWEKAQAV